MILFGHIAGIPVEETLLSFVPIGAVGIGAAACMARGRVSRLRRAASRRFRRGHAEQVERPPRSE